jgi:hypothetical protein
MILRFSFSLFVYMYALSHTCMYRYIQRKDVAIFINKLKRHCIVSLPLSVHTHTYSQSLVWFLCIKKAILFSFVCVCVCTCTYLLFMYTRIDDVSTVRHKTVVCWIYTDTHRYVIYIYIHTYIYACMYVYINVYLYADE